MLLAVTGRPLPSPNEETRPAAPARRLVAVSLRPLTLFWNIQVSTRNVYAPCTPGKSLLCLANHTQEATTRAVQGCHQRALKLSIAYFRYTSIMLVSSSVRMAFRSDDRPAIQPISHASVDAILATLMVVNITCSDLLDVIAAGATFASDPLRPKFITSLQTTCSQGSRRGPLCLSLHFPLKRLYMRLNLNSGKDMVIV